MLINYLEICLIGRENIQRYLSRVLGFFPRVDTLLSVLLTLNFGAKAVGRVLSAIGKAIASVLANKYVRIALYILGAVVGLGLALAGAIQIFTLGFFQIPQWLTIASGIISGANIASYAATALQLGGLLLQGRIGTLIRIIGLMIIGNLVGIIEDSTMNRISDATSIGDFFGKAWQGFKDGLNHIKQSFKRGWETLIPILGFNCGPGWENPNEAPSSSLDKNCKGHDEKTRNDRLKTDPKLRYEAKIKSDRWLIRKALIASTRIHLFDLAVRGQPGSAGEIYRSLLLGAFGVRVLYFRYRKSRLK
jgi:hypothetical protein